METGETTEIVSASLAAECSTQQVKKEPKFIEDELASSSEAITAVETNTTPTTTIPSSVANDTHTISLPSLGNINSLNERQTFEQFTTTPTTVNNDMAQIKTDPTSEDEEQNDKNTGLSSTATTPERPNKQTEILCAAETATSISDIKTNTVKEEPDIPEELFADLLLTTDQMISEQMSPPNIKEVNLKLDQKSISNQPASSASPAVYQSIPAELRSEQSSTEVRGGSGGVEEAELEALPANFFDELLIPARINIKNEINDDVVGGGASVEVADAETEALPENFFDELLEDRVAKRIARLQNEDEEIKYAEKLKNIKQKLRELDESQETESSNKSKKRKHKKSKKKSHKRSKNREDDERERDQDAVNASLDDDDSEGVQHKRQRNRSPIITTINTNMNYDNMPKVAQTPSLTFNEEIYQTAAPSFPAPEELPGSSAAANFPDVGVTDAFSPFPLPYMVKAEPSNLLPDANDDALDCLPVQQPNSSSAFNAFSGFKKIKLEMPLIQLNVKTEDVLPLTPATKRQKALEHAANTIKQLQSEQTNSSSSGFNFTSTVRKLPTSNSYVTQQIYDNRSPLHTINNVDYAFNSNSTRFNLHEWGLVAMPKLVAKVAKIIGCDADTLFSKLKANKNSNKFSRKVKREVDDGEAIDETKSSFFTNAMTQTDDVCIVAGRKRKGHDIGMQVVPARASIDTQTTFAIANATPANNDLPLMTLINQLNENQILALNDFVELIREPASSTAADMYRLRQRMLEIYKCSQMASAMPASALARAPANVTCVQNSNSHYQNTTPGRAPTHISVAKNLNPRYQNTAPVRAPANATGAHNHNPHYQNTALVRPPANIAIAPNPITHYQNNPQPVYSATPMSSAVPTQYLQRNPDVSVRNQIPVVLTHPQQPTTLNRVYQRADPRINAAFPLQPRNSEYQTVPPANYEFDPHNPVSPPIDSGTKYYGRGGMRR